MSDYKSVLIIGGILIFIAGWMAIVIKYSRWADRNIPANFYCDTVVRPFGNKFRVVFNLYLHKSSGAKMNWCSRDIVLDKAPPYYMVNFKGLTTSCLDNADKEIGEFIKSFKEEAERGN